MDTTGSLAHPVPTVVHCCQRSNSATPVITVVPHMPIGPIRRLTQLTPPCARCVCPSWHLPLRSCPPHCCPCWHSCCTTLWLSGTDSARGCCSWSIGAMARERKRRWRCGTRMCDAFGWCHAGRKRVKFVLSSCERSEASNHSLRGGTGEQTNTNLWHIRFWASPNICPLPSSFLCRWFYVNL
jgi:hypothetical protein